MANSKLTALFQLVMALVACVLGLALVGFEVNTLAKFKNRWGKPWLKLTLKCQA